MDWTDFETWLLADYKDIGLAPATVDVTLRKCREMTTYGLDWDRFLEHPEEARRQFAHAYAAKRHAGASVDVRRDWRRAINRAARYAESMDHRFTGLHWRLPPEPRRSPIELAREQVARVLAYEHPDELVSKRRRALVWLGLGVGPRRSEIHAIHVSDLDLKAHQPKLRLRHVAKNGTRRWMPLPLQLRHPKRPLAAYLRLRKQWPGEELWVGRVGGKGRVVPMTSGGLSRDMDGISEAVGFRVSFNHMRNTRAKYHRRHNVNILAECAAMGHSRPDVTMRYTGRMSSDEVADSYARSGVPGYRRLPRQPSLFGK